MLNVKLFIKKSLKINSSKLLNFKAVYSMIYKNRIIKSNKTNNKIKITKMQESNQVKNNYIKINKYVKY